MPSRIVVTLNPDAVPGIDAVAAAMADRVGMRVGFAMPSLGTLVGEVAGDTEVDRIRSMSEVSAVRIADRNQVRRPGRLRN